ncbi:WD repeat-containing protein 35-like isoform X2 [Artemia franciscana]
MINNRNKSMVKGMDWNSDGRKICIAYEDGGVIVGSVDGSRIWGKEIKGETLADVAWSPDSRIILFALGSGKIDCYDSSGNLMCPLEAQSKWKTVCGTKIASMKWFNSRYVYPDPDVPSLCISYKNGFVALLKDEMDTEPIVFNSKLRISCCQWNQNGTVFGIGGSYLGSANSDQEIINAIEFYSAYGEPLSVLKVPGKNFTSFSWEGMSLRIAITVDTNLYFATVRPGYKWCSFGNTIAYAFNKADKLETYIMFWDAKNNERYVKSFRQVNAICEGNEHCLIAARTEEGKECLIWCNTLGTPIDSRMIGFSATYLSSAQNYLTGASPYYVCVWNLRSTNSTFGTSPEEKISSSVSYYHLKNGILIPCRLPLDVPNPDENNSKITCLGTSDKLMLIGTESNIQIYTASDMKLVGTLETKSKPVRLSLNFSVTKLAVIDINGNLTMFELRPYMELTSDNLGMWLDFERKDVWDIRWAPDNPDMFAIMEKTRMYIFRGTEPEEPQQSNAHLCSFKDLEVKAVQLDELLKNPEFPKKDHFVTMEVKSLRDTRSLLQQVGTKEATAFVEKHPHPRLWKLIGETALNSYNFEAAETAFVKCLDYRSVKLVQKLKATENQLLKEAELAAYFGDYEKAEKLYMQADRRDLAVDLRRILGEWDRVLHLLDSSASSTDEEYKEAWDALGEQFSDICNWERAIECFKKSGNTERLVDCYYQLELFDELENLVETMDNNNKIVPKLADMFSSVGMCELATRCYLKCNRPRLAIDLCIKLNHWDSAISLAQKYGMADVKKLLKSYAKRLLMEKKYQQAVDLFKSCQQKLDAALLLYMMAEDVLEKEGPSTSAKASFTLAAQVMQDYEDRQKKPDNDSEPESLLLEISDDIQISPNTLNRLYRYIDYPWKGAEAQHFWILAKNQFTEGHNEAAMRVLYNLQKYEEMLPMEPLYKMLADSSLEMKCFGVCAKAYMKLESLPKISDELRDCYQMAADQIFSKNPPKDVVSPRVDCRKCKRKIHEWCGTCPSCEESYPLCIATGRPVFDVATAVACSHCRHFVIETEVKEDMRCPLCQGLGFGS